MVVVWCCHQALCNTWWHPRHPSGHVLTTLPNNHHNTRAFWCQHTCHNQSTPIPTCVCVCDCDTEPSTMPTSVVINHCVPCQSTTWSFIHQSPPAAAQEQESVVTQMDEGMEAHIVVESNTANQHTELKYCALPPTRTNGQEKIKEDKKREARKRLRHLVFPGCLQP